MKLSRLIELFLIAALASTAAGQEMEPRAYSPAPVSSQFVFVGYGHQSGDVLLDTFSARTKTDGVVSRSCDLHAATTNVGVG